MSHASPHSGASPSRAINPRPASPWLRDVELSHEEAGALERWAQAVDHDPYDKDFPAYDRLLHLHLSGLTKRFAEAVSAFGNAASDAGVLRVRGIPVPRALPPTPTVAYSNIRTRIGTEPVMLALAMLAGQAISIPHIRGGDRVHNIYPMPDDAETQKASNSVRLELHTEMAFVENPPDALAILCLRASDTPPPTDFSDTRSAWDSLDGRQQSLLQEAAFWFRPTGPDGQRPAFEPQPIAKREPRGVRIQYDFGACGVTPEHDAALDTFRERVAETASALTLAPGDLTLIDNRRMVHGRSPMTPLYAGGDRWLQRCLLRLNRS